MTTPTHDLLAHVQVLMLMLGTLPAAVGFASRASRRPVTFERLERIETYLIERCHR